MGKNKKKEIKEDASSTNEQPQISEAQLEALISVLESKGVVKRVKNPKVNVAIRIKTDRGAEYLKSARQTEEIEFLAGNKKSPVSLGTIKYSVDGLRYRAVFEGEDGEVVLFDKEIKPSLI